MLEDYNRFIHTAHAEKFNNRPVIISDSPIGEFEYEETRPIFGYKILPLNYHNRKVTIQPVKTQDDLAEMELNTPLELRDFPAFFWKGEELSL